MRNGLREELRSADQYSFVYWGPREVGNKQEVHTVKTRTCGVKRMPWITKIRRKVKHMIV